MNLDGKIVWITGAGVRLGREMALAAAGRGADVAVHYCKSEAAACEVADEIEALGRRALTIRADLASVDDIREMAADIEEALGGVDVLVNSASNYLPAPVDEIDEAAWDASLDVNLKGAAFCALEAARMMKKRGGGRIVNVADSAAMRPYPGFLPYMIAKGGLITMTRALAVELAPDITVNAIAPGPVLLPGGATPAQRDRAIRRVPLGREGSPADVVAALMWLLEGGDYVTGQVVCVDGGRFVSTI